MCSGNIIIHRRRRSIRSSCCLIGSCINICSNMRSREFIIASKISMYSNDGVALEMLDYLTYLG